MTAEPACERCGSPLEDRRPDARYCGAACRRAAAREREARGAGFAPNPAENRSDDVGRRAHASARRLATLESRLDELGPHLRSADARLLARIIHDALREDGELG